MDGNRKNLIFSLFTPVEDHAKDKLIQYSESLIGNKVLYAETIGVDFKMVEAQSSTYEEIQHEKFKLLDEFAAEYDRVMYVDLDVVFNTDENIFDHHTGFCLHAKHYDLPEDIPDNRRSWYHKVFLASALCMDDYTSYDGMVPNTGIMLTDNPIGFYKDIPALKEKVDGLEMDLGYNNEALFAYWSQTNGLEWNVMDNDWNCLHRVGQELPQAKVYHMISKEFEWLFNNPQ